MAQITLHDSLSEIPAADWDALAAPEQASGRPENPFVTHRFLSALEASGSVGKGTGWLPKPLVLRDQGRPVAALPLFVKTHSQANTSSTTAGPMPSNAPAGSTTPSCRSPSPSPQSRAALPRASRPPRRAGRGRHRLARGNRLSSLHITFCTGDEARSLDGQMGLMHRITQQFHWENRIYATFEDFLSQLSSRKRKMIRKERATAQGHGLTIRALTGDAIEPQHWEAFWAFYQDTGARKWGRPYLTRAAFDAFHATMRNDMLLVLAFAGDRAVAGALNFIGRSCLYGRYWGCIEEYPCLHFELCYHQAIDWAIAQGLQRVEAGAQGEHKLARGYLPVETHSLHWINDPGFRDAVDRYLQAERRAVGEEIEVLTAYGPFRRCEAEP